MNDGVNGVALAVFVFFFVLVTAMGSWPHAGARPRTSTASDEWGLGGRSFGTWVTCSCSAATCTPRTPSWPYRRRSTRRRGRLLRGAYTILVYPLIFTFLPRLWSVSHRHG
ncbi:hypothetical protein GCM10023238_20770 [Streptomyces heliomycini]